MKTAIALGILFVAVLAGGFYYAEHRSPSYTPVTSETSYTSTATTTDTGSGASGGYTATEVAAHSGAASCWTIISGNVYDLTAWITEHPGGEGAILSICGRDGTSAFDGQHGNDPRAQSTLATFKIGALAS